MRKISLAFLIVTFCAIQACRNPESRTANSSDSGSKDMNAKNTAGGSDAGNDEAYKNEKTNSRDRTHESSFDDDSAFFIKEAGTGGFMEVRLANIALKNAADPKVKAFARQMVTDHGNINRELVAIARKGGLILPTAVIPEKQADLDMLKRLSGAAFDKQFMDMMVNDHRKTLELYKSGQQTDKEVVVEFAQKTIPVIERHFAMAQEIQAGLK